MHDPDVCSAISLQELSRREVLVLSQNKKEKKLWPIQKIQEKNKTIYSTTTTTTNTTTTTTNNNNNNKKDPLNNNNNNNTNTNKKQQQERPPKQQQQQRRQRRRNGAEADHITVYIQMRNTLPRVSQLRPPIE